MTDVLNSFGIFIEQLLSFKIIGNIEVNHFLLFFLIIGGIFLLIRVLMEGRK